MSSPPLRIIPSARTLLLAASIYGLFIYALLPSSVMVLDDDFGYLKSVIQTFQHGRPWTDDFLEPWSAASSSLSALVFALTGNFHLSTYGLQAVFAAVTLPGLYLLLAGRDFSPRATLVLTALVLTFPVLMWRALEFNGMALYVPCLLWAIWAASRGRWGVFAVVFLLAVANRQSAAVWLALPGYLVARALFLGPRAGFTAARIPAAVLVGGLIAVAVLHAVMNPTDSQRMVFYETFSRFDHRIARQTIASGAAIFFIAAGLSAALQTLSQAPPPNRPAWRGLFLLAWFVIAVVLLVFDERGFAIVDRIDVWWFGGWLYTKLLVALALAGWLGFRFRVNPAPALCAAASVLLAGLRPSVYDYYFIDTALLGFFAVAPCAAETATPPGSAPILSNRWRPALLAVLSAIGVFHLVSTVHLKSVLDEAHAIAGIYERALRRGQLRHNETFDAHFGFGGWHLFAHGIDRRGNNRTRWFSGFFATPVKSVELAITYPGSFPRRWHHENYTNPDPQLVPFAEESARIAWFWPCRYALQRRAPPAEPSTLGPDFRPMLLPLNNAEWRELAAGPPVR